MLNDTFQAQTIARICHDLISPIGAIGNGVELLAESLGHSPELDLIGQSAESARAKVGFFRIAFDGANPEGTLSGEEFSQIATAMFAEARMRVTTGPCPAMLRRDEARLLYLLLLCTETALPLGGQVEIGHSATGWQLEGHGRRVTCDDAHWAHLRDGTAIADVTAARVHFPLARNALGTIGAQMALESSETRLVLRLA